MPILLPCMLRAADGSLVVPFRHRAHILADLLGDERMFGDGAIHNLVGIDMLDAMAFLDLLAYSPDQARDPNGRFASGDHAAAKEAIGRVLAGEKTAAAQAALMGHLGKLSTKELNSLRQGHGLQASGRTKAALVDKLHDRLSKGRWTGPAANSEGKPDNHWGNKAVQPYYRPGANPTVDNVITRDNPASGAKEILLIRRADKEGVAERGKWALPGGFHDTTAAKGEPWKPGLETAKEAAVRELHEETGLDAHSLTQHLREVGVYEGGGRDPRDNKEAWAKSTAFHLHLPPEHASKVVRGQDDADKAAWKPLSEAKGLAFDHDKIVSDAMRSAAVKANVSTGATGQRIAGQPSVDHRQTAAAWVAASPGLSAETKEKYTEDMSHALSALPAGIRAQAIDSIGRSATGTRFHPDLASLRAEAATLAGKGHSDSSGFVHDSGAGVAMHVDSGPDPRGTYVHELWHAADEGGFHSDSKEWQSAYKKDILKGRSLLSRYAMTNPSEGFAEFGRVMAQRGQEYVAANFPNCVKALKARGLM